MLLWELATYGMNPYHGVTVSQVYKLLETGYRMQCPEGCLPPLYNLMRHCWERESANRPTFSEISTTLKSMSDIKEGKGHYFHNHRITGVASLMHPGVMEASLRDDTMNTLHSTLSSPGVSHPPISIPSPNQLTPRDMVNFLLRELPAITVAVQKGKGDILQMLLDLIALGEAVDARGQGTNVQFRIKLSRFCTSLDKLKNYSNTAWYDNVEAIVEELNNWKTLLEVMSKNMADKAGESLGGLQL